MAQRDRSRKWVMSSPLLKDRYVKPSSGQKKRKNNSRGACSDEYDVTFRFHAPTTCPLRLEPFCIRRRLNGPRYHSARQERV